jgi:hypothetical protein
MAQQPGFRTALGSPRGHGHAAAGGAAWRRRRAGHQCATPSLPTVADTPTKTLSVPAQLKRTGIQPPGLTANKLMLTGKLASAWSSQHCQLGLD